MREFRFLLILSFLFRLSYAKSNSQMIDKTTVKELDLNRYLGNWFEIARFPHSFEKNLVGVTATYSLRDDGKIKVLNQGYKNTLDGEIGSSSDKYFWILCRTPQMDSATYEMLLEEARTRGYNLEKLVKVAQKEN